MTTFILALLGLFLVACLIYWWARGGVIPAIMLTLPLLAALLALVVPLYDLLAGKAQPSAALPLTMLVLLALLAVAWAPRAVKRQQLSAGPASPYQSRPVAPKPQPQTQSVSAMRPPLSAEQLKRRAAIKLSCQAGAATALVLMAYTVLMGG